METQSEPSPYLNVKNLAEAVRVFIKCAVNANQNSAGQYLHTE